MAASAVIGGQVGPWLPFQMWALGWVGAAGGVAKPLVGSGRTWRAVAVLAIVGWLSGHAFGALVNLWFWPFQQGAADVSWVPGIGAGEAFTRYARFYAATSLAWDATRALANVVLIVVFARPILRLLERVRRRVDVSFEVDAEEAGTPSHAPALA